MSDLDALSSSSSSSFTNISGPSSSSSFSQPSIIDHPVGNSLEEENDILLDEDEDDLPSPSEADSDEVSTTTDGHQEEEESDAEREWKESLQQFELLMSLVVVPYLGKYFGRKFAYWGWKRFMEWRYPVEVVVTSKAAFRGAGVVGVAAASL